MSAPLHSHTAALDDRRDALASFALKDYVPYYHYTSHALAPSPSRPGGGERLIDGAFDRRRLSAALLPPRQFGRARQSRQQVAVRPRRLPAAAAARPPPRRGGSKAHLQHDAVGCLRSARRAPRHRPVSVSVGAVAAWSAPGRGGGRRRRRGGRRARAFSAPLPAAAAAHDAGGGGGGGASVSNRAVGLRSDACFGESRSVAAPREATPEATAPARTRRARRFFFSPLSFSFSFSDVPARAATPPPSRTARPVPRFLDRRFLDAELDGRFRLLLLGALGLQSSRGPPRRAPPAAAAAADSATRIAARSAAAGRDGPRSATAAGSSPAASRANAFAPASSNAATHPTKRTRRSGRGAPEPIGLIHGDVRRLFPAAPREHQVHAGARRWTRRGAGGWTSPRSPRRASRRRPEARQRRRRARARARASTACLGSCSARRRATRRRRRRRAPGAWCRAKALRARRHRPWPPRCEARCSRCWASAPRRGRRTRRARGSPPRHRRASPRLSAGGPCRRRGRAGEKNGRPA